MSMPAIPSIIELLGISLGLSLGAIELGVLLATGLFGAAAVQTYLYVSSYPNDRAWIKAVVAIVCVLETVHTAFVWMYLYFLTVTNFGNPFGLNDLPWYFSGSVALQGVVGAIVQAFFSYRVQVVSGVWWLAVPAYFAQIFRGSLAIAITAITVKENELTVFRANHTYLVFMTLIASVVTDVWNTGLLCYYLRDRRTAYTSTSSAVQRIMLWSIETGLVTTSCAILILVFWGTMSGNGLWVAALMVYAKLYSNSLLVSLNARGSIRTPAPSAAASSGGIVVTRTYNVDGTVSQTLRGEPVMDPELGGVQLNNLSSKSEGPFERYK